MQQILPPVLLYRLILYSTKPNQAPCMEETPGQINTLILHEFLNARTSHVHHDFQLSSCFFKGEACRLVLPKNYQEEAC